MSKLVCHNGKFKASAVKGLQIHNQRESENLANTEIDKSRSHLNYDLHNEEDVNYNAVWKERMKESYAGWNEGKRPKADAVAIIDGVISSEKAFFEGMPAEQMKEFFQTAYDQYAEMYGKENIISARVHMDEETPHMHVIFVPLTEDGRLCAKELNDRNHLRELQDRIPAKLKEQGFDIERGETREQKVKHKETRDWKREQVKTQEIELAAKEKDLTEREKSLTETGQHKERVENIKAHTVEKKTLFGGKTDEVVMNKAHFAQVLEYAEIGASKVETLKEVQKERDGLADALKREQETVTAFKVQMMGLKREIETLKDERDKLAERNESLEKDVAYSQKLMREPEVLQGYKKAVERKEHEAYQQFLKENPTFAEYKERVDKNEKREDIVLDLLNRGRTPEFIRENIFPHDVRVVGNYGNEIMEKAQEVHEEMKYLKENPEATIYRKYKAQGLNDVNIVGLMKQMKIEPAKIEKIVAHEQPGRNTEARNHAKAVMRRAENPRNVTVRLKEPEKNASRGAGGAAPAPEHNQQTPSQGLDIGKPTSGIDAKLAEDHKEIDWEVLSEDQIRDAVKKIEYERDDYGMSR